MAGAGRAGDDFDGDGELAAGAVELCLLTASGGRGQRLDRFLAMALPAHDPAAFGELSRTRIQRWIALGAVRCDGRVRAASTRLDGFETLLIEPQPRDADSAFVAEPIPLSVVWCDAALRIIDKPAGLVVHPAAGNWRGTLLNGLLHLDSGLAALPRAGIVHRLDKDTSGLLVVARSERAMAALSEQLADRSMGRCYLALVRGTPPSEGRLEAPIGRDPRQRIRMAVVPPPRGRSACTDFRTLARGRLDGQSVTLLECRLETGRTHQIRVHLSDAGWPLIGDGLYGGPRLAGFERQALHAWQLALRHPDDGRQMAWASPPPADLSALLAQAGIAADALPVEARRERAGVIDER